MLDSILEILFSKKLLALLLICLILCVPFLSACNENDLIMCVFCGCLTPETTCDMINCVDNAVDQAICDCANMGFEGIAACSQCGSDAGTECSKQTGCRGWLDCVACVCKDLCQDENGEIVGEDVDCDACFVDDSGSGN